MNGQFAHGLGRDPAGGADPRAEHMVPQRCRNTEVAVFTHEVMTHVMLLDDFPDAPAHGPLMAGVMGQIVQDVAHQESEDEPGAGIARQSVAELLRLRPGAELYDGLSVHRKLWNISAERAAAWKTDQDALNDILRGRSARPGIDKLTFTLTLVNSL